MFKTRNFKYLFFLILPVAAAAVWYSPIFFKGYSVSPISEQIVLGRNIAKTGMYAMENDLNVLLSSDLIKKEGHLSFMGNKLTGYLYSFVFKFFGFLDWNKIILFSVILNVLTLLIFSLLVFYLFDFKTSFVFSLVYVFSPFVWQWAIVPGVYEFALFFIALFFLFYFLGSRHPSFFIFSGAFLALAGMSRNAFLLFIPVIFLYLLFKKEKRAVMMIFIPLVAVLSLFYLPDFLAKKNAYYLYYFPAVKTSEKLVSNDFVFYSEFYPDPYIYHFDKENFLKEYAQKQKDGSFIESLYLQKSAVNMAADQPGLGRRILIGLVLLLGQLGMFISWEALGGPLIFLLILAGFYFLKKERPQLSCFFVFLVFGVIFLLCFVAVAGRNHLADFAWILALLTALGLLSVFSAAEERFQLNERKKFLAFIIVLVAVLYNMILANHTYWGRVYDNNDNLMIMDYASKMDKLNISNKDVIALGLGGTNVLTLNYLKDKPLVFFHEETIKKILKQNKLDSVFKESGIFDAVSVKGLLAYALRDRNNKDKKSDNA